MHIVQDYKLASGRYKDSSSLLFKDWQRNQKLISNLIWLYVQAIHNASVFLESWIRMSFY